MRHHPAFAIGVSGTALVMLSFAVALEVSAEAVQPGAGSSSAPRNSDIVNRSLKGDRLRVIARPAGTEPFDVQVPERVRPEMADGCESSLGPIIHSSVAQRCVT